MSLRTKTILLLLIVFFVMLIGTVGILMNVMMHRFEAIEQTLLADHMTRTRNALTEKIDNLDKIAFDWGVWDDTYAYIEDHNEDYAAANLVEEVYTNLDIDAMVFIDGSGNFVYALASDEETKTLTPIPQSLADFIRSSQVLNNTNPAFKLEGIVLLPEGPLLVSTSPILPSDANGTVKGNLLVAHWLDDKFVTQLQNQLQLDLTFTLITVPGATPIEANFSVISDNLIQARGTIQDLTGKPIMTVTIQTNREIYNVGEEGVYLVGGFIIVLSGIWVIVLSFFMNTHFLSKLKYITDSVDRIGTDKDFTKRLKKPTSKDEFSIVIHEINGMLDDLEAVQKDNAYKANHDALTGLPNRRLLSELLNYALKKAERDKTMLAVFFLDLDDFKNINDTKGHDTGDEVLIQTAHRLASALRKSDVLARIGGDEFIILLEDIDQIATIEVVANKILDCLKPVMKVNGSEFNLSTSIGISVYPQNGDNSETLFKHADMALYQAKEIGKARYAFYVDTDPTK